MGQVAVDVYVKIKFTVATEDVEIETDVRIERLEEIFEEYLHAQMFTGSGTGERIDRDVYTIMFGLKLDGDIWGTTDDCGNRGLSTGIVMRVFTLLRERKPNIKITDPDGKELKLP